MTALVTLFFMALLAAILLPGYSEVLAVGLVGSGFDPVAVWAAASAGNTAGSCVNWLLGVYVEHFKYRRWFPFKPDRLARAQTWFQHYGVWLLLMSWLPIGGDTLTFVAGIMRVRFGIFLVLTAIGKGTRYALLLGLLAAAGDTFGF